MVPSVEVGTTSTSDFVSHGLVLAALRHWLNSRMPLAVILTMRRMRKVSRDCWFICYLYQDPDGTENFSRILIYRREQTSSSVS
jgi:hypothetical protein